MFRGMQQIHFGPAQILRILLPLAHFVREPGTDFLVNHEIYIKCIREYESEVDETTHFAFADIRDIGCVLFTQFHGELKQFPGEITSLLDPEPVDVPRWYIASLNGRGCLNSSDRSQTKLRVPPLRCHDRPERIGPNVFVFVYARVNAGERPFQTAVNGIKHAIVPDYLTTVG